MRSPKSGTFAHLTSGLQPQIRDSLTPDISTKMASKAGFSTFLLPAAPSNPGLLAYRRLVDYRGSCGGGSRRIRASNSLCPSTLTSHRFYPFACVITKFHNNSFTPLTRAKLGAVGTMQRRDVKYSRPMRRTGASCTISSGMPVTPYVRGSSLDRVRRIGLGMKLATRM